MKTIDDFIQEYSKCSQCQSAICKQMYANGHPDITVNRLTEDAKELYLSYLWGAPATADRFKINIYDNSCEGNFEKFKRFSGRTFIDIQCSVRDENFDLVCGDFNKIAVLEFNEKNYSIKPWKI